MHRQTRNCGHTYTQAPGGERIWSWNVSPLLAWPFHTSCRGSLIAHTSFMRSGNISALNGLDVTIHQRKLYGLSRSVLQDREVNRFRAWSVISFFVFVLSCCNGERVRQDGEERMLRIKGKGEWQCSMCISTQACLIRQEDNGTLWFRVSTHPHYVPIQYQ